MTERKYKPPLHVEKQGRSDARQKDWKLLGVHISPEMNEALQEVARDNEMTRSFLVRKLLREGLIRSRKRDRSYKFYWDHKQKGSE